MPLQRCWYAKASGQSDAEYGALSLVQAFPADSVMSVQVAVLRAGEPTPYLALRRRFGAGLPSTGTNPVLGSRNKNFI